MVDVYWAKETHLWLFTVSYGSPVRLDSPYGRARLGRSGGCFRLAARAARIHMGAFLCAGLPPSLALGFTLPLARKAYAHAELQKSVALDI
jgi:hypothetical protein